MNISQCDILHAEDAFPLCPDNIETLMTTDPRPRSPMVSQADYERLAAFRYAMRRFLRFSEEAAIAAGIPPQQHQALLAIKGFRSEGAQPMYLGDLAEWLQIAPHTAVGLVNRLVKEELVNKEQGTRDRRQMQLSLTEHGESVLESLSVTHREELRCLTPQLRQLLDQIADEPR